MHIGEHCAKIKPAYNVKNKIYDFIVEHGKRSAHTKNKKNCHSGAESAARIVQMRSLACECINEMEIKRFTR